ncbi:amino acid adenylation domain-containing protein [Kitasatospora purpeofusca]|uniref:amino acid adenylation domain-containing protein n=1 Tax=Kitasatospora purpeofusca TaxID=67352 RepID=UPI003867B448|nr:amino acid adenylation domain-containing protein [Kitasatospora purpeofusca]
MNGPDLPTGAEYERLLSALRLETTWAVAGLDPADGGQERPAESLRVTAPARPDVWVPVGEVIDRVSRSDGDRIALGDGSRTVTYRQLRTRTEYLAGSLRNAGVRRGDVVAVTLERGVAFAEVVLAVWRAGGAFLPLKPGDPAAWREQAARAAGVRVAVAAPAEPTLPGVTHLVWPEPDPEPTRADAEGIENAGPDTAAPAAPADPWRTAPGDLAYLIATSGTTGEPKLVMLEHRGVANLVRAQAETLPALGPGSRVLQFSHPTFDGAVFDLLLALAHGGRLEAITDAETSGEPLAAALRRRRVTHAVLPAAVLRTLGSEQFDDLDVVLSVGDVCLPETARLRSARHRFFNGYGPSETTVCATLHRIGADSRDQRVPVGRPVTGVRVVVLDDDLQPVPAGEVGELCIGGEGVGRGYLGRPGPTAEAFVPDPFGEFPGARLYRTGDLGRLLPDGGTEFLGRRDNQLKIRGVRIRLDDVQNTLAALPGVREAAAVAAGAAGQGDRNLVGYVVAQPGHRLTGAGLRAELARRLPAHLLPGAVLVLDAWPLTAGGKLDRSLLPDPRRAADYQAARTPAEEVLTSLAADLFGLARVGRDDSFLALGGNSLLATRFAARAEAALGRRLPLAALLSGATLAELAAAECAGPPRPAVPGPVRAQPDGPHRMVSFAQERIWLMQELRPDSLAYHAQAALRIGGPLDPDALSAALTDLVRRHEVLRSRFHNDGGRLRCTVEPPGPVTLPRLDLGDHPAARQEQLLGEAVERFVVRPFVPAAEPLVRWLLIRLGEHEHVLVHAEHHLVHDGWSFNVFLRDLVEGCLAHQRHGEVRRPEPEIQYYDHARWQREWSGTPEAERQRVFWREELAGASTVLPLPRRAAADRRFVGAAPRVEIDAELARALEALGRRHGHSLYAVLLAAFFALLARTTGADDLLVGSGVANRRWQNTEDLMGMFVNTVVLRARTADDPTFAALLDRVGHTVHAALDHQDLPFEDVLAQSRAEHVPGVNPLVQVSFSFHDAMPARLTAAPFSLDVIEGLGTGSAKFDLNLIAFPRHSAAGCIGRGPGNVLRIPASDGPVPPSPAAALDGITVSWEFDSDQLEAGFVAALMRGYQEILRAVVRAPRTALSELALVSDEQRGRLLRQGQGRQDEPSADRVPDLIARWSARTPDAPAVAADDDRLTYRQLWSKASELAATLSGSGVGGGDLVALHLPRCAGLVVAMLATLMTGAASLTLDPSQPPARLAALLEDSGARTVLTGPDGAPRLPAGRWQVLTPCPDPSFTAPPPAAAPGNPRDLAHVVYTSGSTGRPKGVLIEHRSLVARLRSSDMAAPGPGQNVLATNATVFDVFTMEVWSALLNGATLHLLPAAADPQEIARRVVRDRISHLTLVTPLLQVLAETAPDALARLQALVVGGDTAPPDAVRAVLELGTRRLVNAYGPTEVTVYATAFQADGADRIGTEVPIGRPVSNSHTVLLDDRLNLVPDGCVGEICVGGPGVARGYLGRPAETADRFVPDPYSTEPGARLYRTGDRGQWLPDGNLRFLGRLDHQVKIRGFRVEPEEVRTALAALAGVREAAVVAHRTGGPEARLVGYAQPEPGSRPEPDALRTALAELLPGHLVPETILIVESWPRGATGKVDRSRLPVPPPPRVTASGRPTDHGPAAEVLARVLAELLELPEVGADDDFFQLGGHSLLAMRYAARAARALGQDIDLATVLAHPTVARLSAALHAPAAPPTGPPRRLPRNVPGPAARARR